MPDGIDTTVKQVEVAPREAAVYGARAEAKLGELTPRNHPMLSSRERSERSFALERRRGSVQFALICMVNCTDPRHDA